MIEVNVEQGSVEWLELRRTKRAASETAAVMGLSPWQKPKDIVLAKQGKQQKSNFAMQRGQSLEPIARQAYEEIVGMLRPAVFVNGDYLASLDGIDFWNSLVVEIKCPVKGKESDLWKLVEMGEVPCHYKVQIQHQLMVTELPEAHLWVFDGIDGIAVTLKSDPAIHDDIRSAWDKFWSENEQSFFAG